jgi:hypothetical protein
VIIDWDAKAVALVASAAPGAPAQRDMALVHAAMFDAVNSSEPRYGPYLAQLTVSKTTSQEAAAATAAGTVLDPRRHRMITAIVLYDLPPSIGLEECRAHSFAPAIERKGDCDEHPDLLIAVGAD